MESKSDSTEATMKMIELMMKRMEAMDEKREMEYRQREENQRQWLEKMFGDHSANINSIDMNSKMTSNTHIAVPSFGEFQEKDNFELYLKRINHYFDAHSLTDDRQKCSYFLSWAGTYVYELLQKLYGTDDLKQYNFSEITEKLSAHFKQSTHIIIARHKFWESRKKPNQTYGEWVAELRGLATDCKFMCPNSECGHSLVDENIRDMLLRHTPHDGIRKAALAEENPTLDKLLTIATLYETTNAANETLTNRDSVHHMKAEYKSKYRQKPINSRKQADRNFDNRYKSCHYCNINHKRSECKFLQAVCHKCNKIGHLATVCGSTKNNNKNLNGQNQNKKEYFQNSHKFQKKHKFSETNQLKEENLNKISCIEEKQNKFLINVNVNEHPMKFLLDTGATCSVVGLHGYEEIGSPPLKPLSSQLKSYGAINIPVKGWTTVDVKLGNMTRTLRLLVANTQDRTNIFGATWFNAFGLQFTQESKLSPDILNMIEAIPTCISVKRQTEIDELCQKYSDVFTSGLGTCKDFKAKLYLRKDAIPRFHKPRPVPFSQKEAVKKELDRLVQAAIIKPIPTSDWAAPIVVVPKPDGKVRICGDFKVTINPQLCIEQYPLPRTEELFQKLQNGKHFTKIDLSDAYLQIELDEEAKKLAVINTQHGLFQYQRLAFGIASAPAIFQRYIEQLIGGLDNCACFLDDIIVTGSNDEEHLKTLEQLLKRFQDTGLRCNKKKCDFFKPEVEYLGNIISSEGIRPSETNLEAIKQLPEPKNLNQLTSFLGKINYYNKFIPNFSELAGPLNALRRKNIPFVWTKIHKDSFTKLKDAIVKATRLVHFDPNLPIILASDASSYGIGAVLSHRYPDGSEKPIAFASKTMNSHELNYSQIEKEALSIIFGVKKFHQYLYGLTKPFELQTDHKPLLSIFSPDHKLPVMSMQRIQRWAILLMSYNFKIKYRATDKHANADALSRLPKGPDVQFDRSEEACLSLSLKNEDALLDFPINADKVKHLTSQDPILSKVFNYVKYGWPDSFSNKNDFLRPYFERRLDLSLHNGVLIWNTEFPRVIVPKKLQNKILSLLHQGHFGIIRMKQLARRHCWWPRINSEIENMVKNCKACQVNQANPPAEYSPWPKPERPWERIHIDFAGPFMSRNWLIVVDAFSKYPYVCDMRTMTSENTIRMLSKIFIHEGLPETIVSDNGTQFTSELFRNYCNSHGIEHLTTAPFHPASNGEAERFVRTFKQAMSKICWGGSMDNLRALDELLFAYRTTPNPQSGKSPAELLHGRQPRSQLSLMLPIVKNNATVNRSSTKFKPKDHILYKNYSKTGDPWLYGTIEKSIGNKMYKINTENSCQVRRHQNQIRRNHAQNTSYDDFLFNDVIKKKIQQVAPMLNILPTNGVVSNATPQTQQHRDTDSFTPRRSTRVRKPVNRYSP